MAGLLNMLRRQHWWRPAAMNLLHITLALIAAVAAAVAAASAKQLAESVSSAATYRLLLAGVVLVLVAAAVVVAQQSHMVDARQVVIVMLVHKTGVEHPVLWEFLELCGYRVIVHLKTSVPLTKELKGHDFIKARLVPEKYCVDAEWGDVTLLDAMLQSVGYALGQCKAASCFYFTSGADIPLEGQRALKHLAGWGNKNRTILSTMWQDPQVNSSTSAFRQWGGPLAKYADFLLIHSQWVALDRCTAEYAVQHRAEILAGAQEIHEEIKRACRCFGVHDPSSGSEDGTSNNDAGSSDTAQRSARSSSSSSSGSRNNNTGSGAMPSRPNRARSSNSGSRSNRSSDSSSNSSSSSRGTEPLPDTWGRLRPLSPDEFWLTVLAYLWHHNPPPQPQGMCRKPKREPTWMDRQRRSKEAAMVDKYMQENQQKQQQQGNQSEAEAAERWRNWKTNHTVDIHGTCLVFTPDYDYAQKLGGILGLTDTPAPNAPWCADSLGLWPADLRKADAATAWLNTKKVTQWVETHPITFKRLHQKLLWADARGVVCSSLYPLLHEVAAGNDTWFSKRGGSDKNRSKSNKAQSKKEKKLVNFMFRKVGPLEEDERRELYVYIKARLSIPAPAK